jgi:hypothetical protein
MPISFILTKAGTTPDIRCDVCGTAIRYPDDPGYVLWDWWPGDIGDAAAFKAAIGTHQPYWIAHQGRCDDGTHPLTMALDEFLWCLLHNIRITPKPLREAGECNELLSSLC